MKMRFCIFRGKSKSKNYFFDIGAHYGFYTINLQKYFDKIYSFEANPLNYEILKYNIQKRNSKIQKYIIFYRKKYFHRFFNVLQ